MDHAHVCRLTYLHVRTLEDDARAAARLKWRSPVADGASQVADRQSPIAPSDRPALYVAKVLGFALAVHLTPADSAPYTTWREEQHQGGRH